MNEYCYDCGADIDWDAIPWDVGTHKDFIVKAYDCECGNKPSISYLKDKEEREAFNNHIEYIKDKL